MSVVRAAPGHRLPFVFPLYDDGPHRPWFVRTGVLLYSALARAKLNGRVSEKRALRLVPQLPHRGLALLGALRRCLDERRAADARERPRGADRGAAVLNYAEVTAIDGEGAMSWSTARPSACRPARSSNATGPWLDRVRRLEDPAPRRRSA